MKTIEFYSRPECAPCDTAWLQLMRSKFDPTEYDIQKIDTQSYLGQTRAKAFGIKSVPTVIVLSEMNDELARAVGATPVAALIDSLEY